jgi:very-short-patch-repair endonuclease
LHVFEQGGIRVTTLPRTAVDLARTLPFRESVIALDAIRRTCSAEQLREALDECARWSDVGKARLAIEFADPRSESALESLSRAAFHEHGVPRPRVQAEVRGASGRRYRVDFLWDAWRLIGESDGAEKYVDREALLAEKRREDDLREAGYGFIRWSYAEIVGRTSETIDRVMRRLCSAPPR